MLNCFINKRSTLVEESASFLSYYHSFDFKNCPV